MISFTECLERIVEIEEALTVTYNNDVFVVSRVYPYVPDEQETIEAPCWMNTWTLFPVERMSVLRELQYDVRMQFAFHDSQLSNAFIIAELFHEALIAQLDQDITLGGHCNRSEYRGGEPTGVGYTFNKVSHAGLDMHLRLYLKDAIAFS